MQKSEIKVGRYYLINLKIELCSINPTELTGRDDSGVTWIGTPCYHIKEIGFGIIRVRYSWELSKLDVNNKEEN